MALSREFAIGLTKLEEKDFKAAIHHFSNAIDENDQEVDYFTERAVAYLHIEEYDLSLFDMNKAVKLDPNYSYRYSCRAFLKARMGDLDGALIDYQKAIELDPDDAIAHNNLGLVQEQKGYMKESQKSFDKSNEIIGYNPEKRFGEEDKMKAAKSETARLEEEAKQEKSKESGGKIAKDVFRNKNTFKEFVAFIGNGFKLKDKSKRKK